ncbi:MAG: alpha/beta hydrolase [Ruminococcaceae bacterium]|nr:alpha/beta hydrolase [Oscillospiraceae bacterium]
MLYETIQLGDFKKATLTAICLTQTNVLKQTPRRAIIICPGGGYHFLSDREAEPIAIRFLAAGFATFVLRYGIGENAADYRPLKHAALAIRYVREHAADYNVDPDYVFTCGFSAGGHLAASAGVLWDSPVLDDLLEGAPRDIARPTGMILSYPVITADSTFGHMGSFRYLCGTDVPTDEQRDVFSLEKHVKPTTPPAFLWHTFNDTCVPVQNSLMLAEAMAKAGVPFEMHIFPAGIHGLALCNEQTASDNPAFILPNVEPWAELAITWARHLTV